ncbi:MAG: type II toxin-antitoxin system RelE/ParE family toxin [Thermomicrobiales bacterium]
MSSPPRLSLNAEARADLDENEILEVSRQVWGERQVRRYASAINRGFRTSGQFPDVGRQRSDLRPGVRTFPVESHLILCEEQGNVVTVLRIVHQHQQLDDLSFD